MRSVSASMKKKLASRIQAGDSAMSASLWVGRPTTPLTEDRFLERQTILSSGNITKTSIAVCHPRLMRGATEVYIGYLESGTIKIAKTTYVEEMERHVWENDIGFSQAADDFCLCFDGTMPKAANGYVEFKTEQSPWVFWTLNGALYGKRVSDENEPIMLAETNCSTVSAVRAMWSSVGGYDFGLVVFFLLEGKLYYRQLIDGEFKDAEIVSFGPSGVTWEKIAAFRTWDYRIGLQAMTTDGVCYELFTQFMGIGKQNTEHVEIKSVSAKSGFIEVQYKNTKLNEHIDLSNISSPTPYGGLYSTLPPSILSVHNEEDENGDWGKIVIVTFDVHLSHDAVASNATSFTIVDSNGAIYMASKATLDVETAKVVKLEFADFNAAFDVCQLKYTPGTVKSLADTSMESLQFAFVPENLNPPQVDPPEAIEIWNTNEDGTSIAIKFTEAITNNPSGNEGNFAVTVSQYDYVPGGKLSNVSKNVVNVKMYAQAEEMVDISSVASDNITFSRNELSLGVLSDE